MAIICTEDDKDFELYSDKVNNRKVVFTFKQIFFDWWDTFLIHHPNINIRDIVGESVNKLLTCGTLFAGFSIFICECLNRIFVCHTCKSRFCPSCGNKYNEERATSIKKVLFNHSHRHAVFTIPEDLRRFFREDRIRLNILFKAVDLTIKEYFKFKNIDALPAFVSILHTYGRSLIWNPHIHVLLLEGGIKKGKIVNCDFFSYSFFRKKFMFILLNLMEDEIGKDKFKATRIKLWNNYRKDGFYVHTPKSKFSSLIALIRYVTRYLSRPVMAQSRILDYDGTFITFWYQRHEDDKIVIERVHAFDFIKRLIIHIPDKNFKCIRYFGAYHNSSKENKPKIKLFADSFISHLRKMNHWKEKIMNDFKKNPLICPKCGLEMIYFDSVFT